MTRTYAQSIWTLTVDHPNDGITTTVHTAKSGAEAELDALWIQADLPEHPDGTIQSLCDNGYVVYIKEHILSRPKGMGQVWIEYTASDDSGGARWSPVTDEQIDKILAYTEQIMGRRPDTQV